MSIASGPRSKATGLATRTATGLATGTVIGASDSLARRDRRTFIGLVLGLLSLPLGARAASSAFTSTPSASPSSAIGLAAGAEAAAPPAISPNALLATLSDPVAAGRLGQRYLADHPQEQDVSRLVEQLLAALNAQQRPVPTDRIGLQQALTALIQHEYVTSATLLSVDGWLLAPSEARLYALAALAPES
ncbi:hypothetical protein U5801_23360 [Lamprobacter modestohalophilus]|uniref:hypothetical protein n=1 Tax=Lamprobacter modestohalophilus TaxID=1064514 RepID=UPI002ADEDCB3|nr:hypothetical protein [Lamprobacter modestohalophilus]MEA1052726.1 hypothetical protein [Lamprobacter modestohalophilus]